MWPAESKLECMYRGATSTYKRPFQRLTLKPSPEERRTRQKTSSPSSPEDDLKLAIQKFRSQVFVADDNAAEITASHVYTLSKKAKVSLANLMEMLTTAEERAMVLAYADCTDALRYCENVDETRDHPCLYDMMTKVSSERIAGKASQRSRRTYFDASNAHSRFREDCSAEFLFDGVMREVKKFKSKYRLSEDDTVNCVGWLAVSQQDQVPANLRELRANPQFEIDLLAIKNMFKGLQLLERPWR